MSGKKNAAYDGYHETRLALDPKREKVWRPVTAYLQRFVKGSVLDLGCGHADFLRFVDAKNKTGVDIYKSPAFPKDASFVKAPCWDLSAVKKADTVFTSNLFEHLSEEELDKTLAEIKRVLPKGGRLIIVQPNFTYCFKNYFDDYTHKRVFTHVSLPDLLQARGFNIVTVKPKFTPFSMRSRVPVASWLVWLYLRSPIKPMAGQMLVVVEK